MYRAINGFEYKYIVQDEEGAITSWTPGDNISCKIPESPSPDIKSVSVGDVWDKAEQSVNLVKVKPSYSVVAQCIHGAVLSLLDPHELSQQCCK